MPIDKTPLDFDALQHDLRDFAGSVIAVEIRLDGALIVKVEGEYTRVSEPGDPEVRFDLGGKKPPERDGVRFIVACWGEIHISEDRFVAARRVSQGIGAPMITIETNVGMSIQVWQAMPPRQQWTEMHDDNR